LAPVAPVALVLLPLVDLTHLIPFLTAQLLLVAAVVAVDR
jgi:hypothetical protein